MKTAPFEQLHERIAAVLERHDRLKGAVQPMEGRLAKKDREISEIKKKLDAALQQREQLRRKIVALIEKIEALDI